MEKEKSLKACPRCGSRYSYIESREVGEKTYFYAVHYFKSEGGKRKVKKCYLGPELYDYVSRLHGKEGVLLRGLVAENRVLEYLEAIINHLSHTKLNPKLASRIADKLEEIARKLREGRGID